MKNLRSGSAEGYLSVFMSVVLTVVLALCLVLIEAARYNTVRLETECIVDVGMNSVLAEYHRELFEQYDLLYVDSSYGTSYPSYYNTEARFREYLEKNTCMESYLLKEQDGENAVFEAEEWFRSKIYMDLLQISFPVVKVIGISLATDNDGYTFQRQAVKVVESHMGMDAAEQLFSWLEVIEEYNLLDNPVDEKINELEEQLDGLRGKQQLEDKTWIAVEVGNPVQSVTGGRKGLLYWVLDNMDNLSRKTVDLEQYISFRKKMQQMNEGNMDTGETLSLAEKILFHEYLLQYAGNFLEQKENGTLDYQVEYLLFGEASDRDNLRKSAEAICGLRESINLLCLMEDGEKRELIAGASALLSAALLVPEAEPVFEGLILLGWSCLESVHDTKILLAGGKVPLLKDASSWNCTLDNVFGGNVQEEGKSREGLGYEDYMRIFLYLADLSDITYRFMDVMEMDIRSTRGNQAFRIDGCIDCLEIQITAESLSGYTYTLKCAKGYY